MILLSAYEQEDMGCCVVEVRTQGMVGVLRAIMAGGGGGAMRWGSFENHIQ